MVAHFSHFPLMLSVTNCYSHARKSHLTIKEHSDIGRANLHTSPKGFNGTDLTEICQGKLLHACMHVCDD